MFSPRSLVSRAVSGFLGPAPSKWPSPRFDVPPELRGGSGLPPQAPQGQPRDFRVERPLEVAWSDSVQGRPAESLSERIVRRVVDLRLAQLRRVARRISRRRPRPVAAPLSPPELTAEIRARADAAGLSGIGVAAFDQRWHFEECSDQISGDRIIVAAVEQDYERMQQAPDREYQLTVRRTYARLLEGAIEVARVLHRAGYRANLYERDGGAMTIPYAISAGLGQLGMNGQVLTPHAGSRARMLLISTDAPLLLDEPVDYGIPGICQRCGICARRCPVGAISLRQREHGGVKKWKVKTDRCLPMVAQADGCAICIKTCPIQRYGLEQVLDVYRRSGKIVGQGGELETYEWPLDGDVYESGRRPRLQPEVRCPPGLARARRREGAGGAALED